MCLGPSSILAVQSARVFLVVGPFHEGEGAHEYEKEQDDDARLPKRSRSFLHAISVVRRKTIGGIFRIGGAADGTACDAALTDGAATFTIVNIGEWGSARFAILGAFLHGLMTAGTFHDEKEKRDGTP